MADDQPGLFHPVEGVRLKHTVASKRGQQWVEQCRWCGLVACVVERPATPAPGRLGPCPSCGQVSWGLQHVPPTGVGMLAFEETS